MRKMSRNAKVLTTLVVLVFAGAIAAAPDTAEDVLVGWLEDNDCSLTFDDYIDRSLSVDGFAPIDMKNAMDSTSKAISRLNSLRQKRRIFWL